MVSVFLEVWWLVIEEIGVDYLGDMWWWWGDS